MSRYLILWSVVIVMVGAAILDDIFLRRTLDPQRAQTDPVDGSGESSGNARDRAKLFGSDGNNERILGVLQALYRFR